MLFEIGKSGEKCPRSGTYRIHDEKFRATKYQRKVWEGDPFPPAPGKRHTYWFLGDL